MKPGSAIEYNGVPCVLRTTTYRDNGNLALRLETCDGEAYATCTVNVGRIDDSLNAIAVKDYSENCGMLDFLRKAGIAGETLYWVPSGFVKVPVVKLAEEGLELFGRSA